MPQQPYPSLETDPARFDRRVRELRQALEGVDPHALARHTGAEYQADPTRTDRGQFRLPLWGREVCLTYPGLTGTDPQQGAELPLFNQVLLLYYFHTADGSPPSGQWISFADLPDGRFYNQAFQGYTGRELAKAFGSDLGAFERAALRLGGAPHDFGDLAFIFQPLPRFPLLAAYWQGDEDFPASCQLLFDASASHYLPTDGAAVLGSNLTRRLIAQKTA